MTISIISTIMLVAVCLWIISILYAHYKQPKLNHIWEKETISHYLVGVGGIWVRLAFYLFGTALLLWGIFITPVWWIMAIYILAGIGTAGAALTKLQFPSRRYHLISSGIAFSGAATANLLMSFGHPIFLTLAIAPFALAAYYQIAHDKWAPLLEQITAAFIMIWLLSFSIMLIIHNTPLIYSLYINVAY